MFTELGRDHVLTMIAVSLTYFKMSSRRFVDAVPMLIMHHLMGRWAASIRTQNVCTLDYVLRVPLFKEARGCLKGSVDRMAVDL